MQNITPPKEVPASAELIKAIDELNEKSQNDNGQWLYCEELGIVWQPTPVGDAMGKPVTETYKLPPESTPPVGIESLVKWGKMIDFDNLPMNAVVIIKLNVQDPIRVQMMQRAIAKQVLEPRAEKLKANKTCILFMEASDDISVMSEEDMKLAGWEKKEKKLIITLDA